ncbi:glutamyl-tRNA reductase [Specibacter cremeus]|uniref:glutamyl-tRNA reductase n=1 Tax=Specibacter cremeus TaxID=1629051 RepID=UPI000F7A580A|nr:glutamyl-tRNA reductase [Specibacter cremeus]
MVLFSLAASHADLDLETVARLSAGATAVSASLADTVPEIVGTVELATCNRYELYVHARSAEDVETARDATLSAISAGSGLDAELVSSAFTMHRGPAVPKHLFSVSAGLDSAVVGEREIAGQVRRALAGAQEVGSTTPALVRLFQAASKTARDVGARTALGSRGMSIVSIALDLAAELRQAPDSLGRSDSLRGARAVLFGTGAYAGATMAQLADRGCTDIAVYSSSGRANDFTASRGGAPLTDNTLPLALAGADLLIGCSGSDHQVAAAEVARVRQDSPAPLVVIDLALSHDFDPAVGELPNVDLLTLETVRQAAPAEQETTLEEAGAIVAEAANTFEAAQHARSLDHAIVALRRHTMAVLDAEIEKIRGQHGCTAATEQVEFAMRRMVRQLLHTPTVRAKELAAAGDGDSYLAGLEALYGISVEPAAFESVAAEHLPAVPAVERAVERVVEKQARRPA